MNQPDPDNLNEPFGDSEQLPPAEAQPVACIECEGEGYTYADDGETTEPCLPCGGSGVRQQPPSAPVGVEWPVDELSREKTLKVLREHNAWRRGAKGPQTDPRMLGLALDAAIAALAQQPAAVGEEIMVNAAHDVYTLPLQPSGLSSGPRFVVHVPGPEQTAAVDEALDRLRRENVPCLWHADLVGNQISEERMRVILTAALAAQQGGNPKPRETDDVQ